MSEKELDSHLDPNLEIGLETVKNRALRGVVVLTGRTFFLQILSFAAWFLLSVFLDAKEIGIFFIVSAVVNFLRYFSDVGLAASLIQKKETIDDSDLRTTFTVQQALVITLLIVLYLITPYLESYYSLSFEATLLLSALGIAFLLSSLKTIPSVLLERELKFDKLVIPEVLENLVYNFAAVYFAWQGLGVRSFTYAVVMRSVVGLLAIYIIRPWLPGLALSKRSLRKLLAFGVPYQLNTFLATIKDDGMTAFLGGILGSSGLGYLAWAQKWAQTPLRLFLDNVTKVTFPAFSRMQEDKKSLERGVTRSIFFVAFFTFPLVVGIILLAPILIEIIPRYEKWQPALIPLYLVSVNVVFAVATTQLTNLLNAIGKIKITFKLMLMWTALTWLFVPFFSIKAGVSGAALGYSLVGLSSVVAIYVARKYVAFSLLESIYKPAFASFLMGVVVIVLRNNLKADLSSLVILATVGVVTYAVTFYAVTGSSIITDVKKSFRTFFQK